MNQKIPIVFIGPPEMATVFQNSLSLDSSIFHFYTTEPVNALKNENYEKQSEQKSHLVVGPGTAGCSIAHLNAQSIIQNHFIAPPPQGGRIPHQGLNRNLLILEALFSRRTQSLPIMAANIS